MPSRAQPGGDVGVLRRVVEQDEVGAAGEDGLDVGRDAVAQVGHFGGGGRIVAPGGAADDGGTGADGEEQLGRGGDERDDATRGRGDRDRVARVVHDAAAGRRRRGRPAGGLPEQQCRERGESNQDAGNGNRPSPGSKTGGARRQLTRSTTPPTLPRGYCWWRERRGLLASGLRSPSRLPSGVVSEEFGLLRGRARYSGGAAPVLHRFPSVPVRVVRLCLAAQAYGAGRRPQERARAPP